MKTKPTAVVVLAAAALGIALFARRAAAAIDVWDATFTLSDDQGYPLSGALITLAGVPIDTDLSGRALFTGLLSGNYGYTVSLEGYETISGQLRPADFVLI